MLHSYVYQIIGEKIAVAGTFTAGSFTPCRLRWGKRTLNIQTITMRFSERDGRYRNYLYSVVADGLVLRLRWQVADQQWWLAELWSE